jgi:ATP-dependent RNA helicase DeaD
LGLSDLMLASLERAAYLEPTPVQAGIIPRALAGTDVLGQARTGTGKTAAFAIPIIERIKHGGRNAPPRALVLVPTRELAVQVRDEFEKLAHGRRLTSVPIYGGKPIRGQIAKLQGGADVVIGTPGRILDHIGRSSLDLRSIQIVVLDEADRMLDIGFRPDIEKILRRCPRDRQTLLLSATVAPPVERLARTYMRDPEIMDFSPKTKAVETIEQYYFTVDQEQKFDLLVRLLKRDKPEQAIIFCRTKRGTERIYRRLSKHFPATDTMHGDMVQGARDRVMKKFRAGEVRILVATDVVGRGIDVSSISHIINYDIPQSSDDYVHRVGRTGRMGREGVAYTFVTTEEGAELTRIEMLINRLLKRDEIEGFNAVATVAPPLAGTAATTSATPSPQNAEAEAPKPPRPTPPGRRPPKRHRRAL